MDRNVLLRIVKATRMSLRMAEDMKRMLVNDHAQTWADEIAGMLCDAVFLICGEQLEVKQDFNRDSRTMQMLTGEMTDGEVTNEILHMTEQPKPNVYKKEERKEMYRTGGYVPRDLYDWGGDGHV